MKIVVTGTEGYIGTQLVPILLAHGHEVVGLDTGFYRDGCLYEGIVPPSVHLAKDLRHVSDTDFEGADAIVHLAELSNDPLGELNPTVTYAINHHGTVALAQRCKRLGIPRFVYMSSCSVYGVGSDDFKTETSPLNPQTAYAECKALVERDLQPMADKHFSPTFLRNATAYGPSQRMRFDLVVNNLAGLAWTTGEIRMTSDGTPWRPLVHVRDICHAITCVLDAPRELVHNQIFNVGNTQENYRIRDIANIIAQTFPGCQLSVGTSGGDNRSYRVSFDKVHTLLPGFKCQHTVETGAEELRELFSRIQMTSEIFHYRGFTRLKQLQHLIQTNQLNAALFWNLPAQENVA
jgi:nucleoside-diphosphate-sugar epimerase